MLAWAQDKAPRIAPSLIAVSQNQMVLEFLAGPSLYQQRLELIGQSQIFEKLKLTLYRLHESGMAHGELRLSNIMWQESELRLVDFATAVTKNSPLFMFVCWLDDVALLWMKSNIFHLPLEPQDIEVQEKHRVLHKWFLKYIAADIPVA